MSGRFHHEQIYRGLPAMRKLAGATVHICGAGALGSNIAVNLARSGCSRLTVIDRDRVEEQNIGTQVYSYEDVGGRKADLLRNLIFREVGVEIRSYADELNANNVAKLLRGAELVVDTFDNSNSRRLIAEFCKERSIACLHAGVNDEYGEVTWNETYLVPQDGGLDACDYPLGRSLILLVSAVAGEASLRYILKGVKESYSITLGDLSINKERSPI